MLLHKRRVCCFIIRQRICPLFKKCSSAVCVSGSGGAEGWRLGLSQRNGGGDKFCQIGCNSYKSHKGHRLFNRPLKPRTDCREPASVTVNNWIRGAYGNVSPNNCPINTQLCLLQSYVEKQANKILNQCVTNGDGADMQSVTALESWGVWPFLWCCSVVYHWRVSAMKPTGSPLTFLWHFTVWMWRPTVWHKLSHLQGLLGANHHLSVRILTDNERRVTYRMLNNSP